MKLLLELLTGCLFYAWVLDGDFFCVLYTCEDAAVIALEKETRVPSKTESFFVTVEKRVCFHLPSLLLL